MAKRKHAEVEETPVDENPLIVETSPSAPARVLLDMIGPAGMIVIVEADQSHYERCGYTYVGVHTDEEAAPVTESESVSE